MTSPQRKSRAPVPGCDYRPAFLTPDEATILFRRLVQKASWHEEWLHLYGRRIRVPRMLAWYGDAGVNYRYSGSDHVGEGWLPELQPLRARLAAELRIPANFVLVNRYRDGSDYMGWHSDDERGLSGPVASVSLGATRRFLVRPHGQPRSDKLDLEHGALLLLEGSLAHSLPRTSKPTGERINLTFRCIDPGAG